MSRRWSDEQERQNFRSGLVAATVINSLIALGGKKRNAKFIEPLDFFKQAQEEGQTWERQLMIVEVMNAAFGGVDLRKKHGDSR